MSHDQAASVRDLAGEASLLRALHVPGDPLILANVWDPASASTVEAAGARVIATASAALAPVNGYEDHGNLPVDVAFSALRRISRAVQAPVTADLEDGYGLSADQLVARLIEAGACGLNIEDTDHRDHVLRGIAAQTTLISAIKAAGKKRGVELVINARVDAHYHRRPVEEGIERARHYLAAGADCVYPIFCADPSVIKQYVAVGPTNILLRPGGISLADQIAIGVARVSLGPVLHHLVTKRLQVAVQALYRRDEKSLWAPG